MKVRDLTHAQLSKVAKDLESFYTFSFFSERGVDISIGLTYAIEFAACALDLHAEEDDNAEIIELFVIAVDKAARSGVVDEFTWDIIAAELPFARGLGKE
ncbi:hypothetical protein OCF84_21565 (plasmid) [Shewanella xiamenensis]|uniref:Uncharacterized protein n=1 Tax=Shewanella xiamenensis TaxID=332186 RepID=A0ABT6UDJ1_9GAMM|nr:hypothetical protein [Shewanella xiamenensis]MDI5832534.1 hypothetical protein [Shewanella xiamenensis]WHF57848.1 hypothetical protein OCF84_21565 [Shewanella xiamenensis]